MTKKKTTGTKETTETGKKTKSTQELPQSERKPYVPMYQLDDFAKKPKSKKALLRPVAARLSPTESRRQIIYVCPHCGASFEMYGSMARECWKCERGMDWTGLPMQASVKFREEYEAILYDTDGRRKLTEKQKADAALKRLEEYVARASESAE